MSQRNYYGSKPLSDNEKRREIEEQLKKQPHWSKLTFFQQQQLIEQIMNEGVSSNARIKNEQYFMSPAEIDEAEKKYYEYLQRTNPDKLSSLPPLSIPEPQNTTADASVFPQMTMRTNPSYLTSGQISSPEPEATPGPVQTSGISLEDLEKKELEHTIPLHPVPGFDPDFTLVPPPELEYEEAKEYNEKVAEYTLLYNHFQERANENTVDKALNVLSYGSYFVPWLKPVSLIANTIDDIVEMTQEKNSLENIENGSNIAIDIAGEIAEDANGKALPSLKYGESALGYISKFANAYGVISDIKDTIDNEKESKEILKYGDYLKELRDDLVREADKIEKGLSNNSSIQGQKADEIEKQYYENKEKDELMKQEEQKKKREREALIKKKQEELKRRQKEAEKKKRLEETEKRKLEKEKKKRQEDLRKKIEKLKERRQETGAKDDISRVRPVAKFSTKKSK